MATFRQISLLSLEKTSAKYRTVLLREITGASVVISQREQRALPGGKSRGTQVRGLGPRTWVFKQHEKKRERINAFP